MSNDVFGVLAFLVFVGIIWVISFFIHPVDE